MFINQDLNTEFFKNIKNRKNKKRKNKKRKNKKSINNSYLNNIEQIFDNKKTFEENYKSLTPDQIKGLNNDTQELINTQKNLIKTLKQMGPTLTQGKEVLDTFKNYFGKDTDLKL